MRSYLKYANSAWYPKRKNNTDKLELEQKTAIELIPELT